MSDGKNKQEFQMGQLEEKHDKDGNGKASDHHWTGIPMSSPVTSKPTLCAKPCAKQHPVRKFFITRLSKASNSLFSLFTSPSALGIVWELESHLEYSVLYGQGNHKLSALMSPNLKWSFMTYVNRAKKCPAV